MTNDTTPPQGPTTPDSLLVRKEAAKRSGHNQSKLRRLEKKGLLTPVKGEDGIVRYRAEQVVRLRVNAAGQGAAVSPSALSVKPTPHATTVVEADSKNATVASSEHVDLVAGAVFGMFNRGVVPIKVVEELGLRPELVEDLYAKWCRMVRRTGRLIVAKDDLVQVQRALGRIETSGELAREASRLANDRAKLKRFAYRCRVCGIEIQADPDREWASVLNKQGHLGSWGHAPCIDADEDATKRDS